jgi:hypothetical protein
MTEERAVDQGFLKGVGNVTNNQTYIDTYPINYSSTQVMEHLRLQMDKVLLGYPLL